MNEPGPICSWAPAAIINALMQSMGCCLPAPVGATATAKPEAKEYLDYLHSQAAKAVLEKYGFNYLIKPTS